MTNLSHQSSHAGTSQSPSQFVNIRVVSLEFVNLWIDAVVGVILILGARPSLFEPLAASPAPLRSSHGRPASVIALGSHEVVGPTYDSKGNLNDLPYREAKEPAHSEPKDKRRHGRHQRYKQHVSQRTDRQGWNEDNHYFRNQSKHDRDSQRRHLAYSYSENRDRNQPARCEQEPV